MIRTGDDYREFIRGNRDIHIDGERVRDVTNQPPFARWSISARASMTCSRTRRIATS